MHVRIPLMFRRMVEWIMRIIPSLAILGLIILCTAQLAIQIYALPRTYSISDIPAERAAIVFGAGLWRDGSPTPVLSDRVAVAAELYFSGKVEKILLSGDNRFVDYNEPAAMRELALQLGVPDEALALDYAGRRTYDTCYRAVAIFGLEGAILVTQAFHLPRAIYTCNMLGLPSSGVEADQREYNRRSVFYWNMRELGATIGALWDVHFSHPIPVMGEPLYIFPEVE